MNAIHTDPVTRRAKAAEAPPPDSQSPAARYQELFVAVQSAAIFTDSKTFVDCAPLGEPQETLAAYRAECTQPGFDLKALWHGILPTRSRWPAITGRCKASR